MPLFFIFFITSHCKAMGSSRFHNTNQDFLCNYCKKMLNDFQYLIKKCLVCFWVSSSCHNKWLLLIALLLRTLLLKWLKKMWTILKPFLYITLLLDLMTHMYKIEWTRTSNWTDIHVLESGINCTEKSYNLEWSR